MFEVTIERTFVARHGLRYYKGETEPLHEHTWRVWITVSGELLDPSGCLLDFIDLDSWFNDAIADWNDQVLNDTSPFKNTRDVRPLSPSAENVARAIYESIASSIPEEVRLIRVEVEEEKGCRASYYETTEERSS